MHNRLPESELRLLAAAAQKAEIPSSRVDMLRGRDPAATPLFLLAGLSTSMDLLLQEVPPLQAKPTPERSGDYGSSGGAIPPIVTGANASVFARSVGSWNLIPGNVPARGALVAVRVHPDFPSQSHAAIASIPRYERGMLVTQTSQPLGQPERQLLRLMASHCVEVGVIYLCYRGDDIDDAQLAELRKFASGEAMKAGISFSAYQDAVLYTLKSREPGNTDILAQFRFEQPVTEQAEMDFLQKVRKDLIQDLLRILPENSPKEISPADQRGIKERFQRYLNSVEERLPLLARKKQCSTTDEVRKLYTEEMYGWQNKASIEGATMYHLETLAPGTMDQFKQQIQLTSDNLELIVKPKPLLQNVKRFAIPFSLITAIWGFLAGCLGAWYFFHYTGSFKEDARMMLLQIAPWLGMGLMISLYLYARSRSIVKSAPPLLKDEGGEVINGWPDVKNQMLGWLENHLTAPSQDIRKDICQLKV